MVAAVEILRIEHAHHNTTLLLTKGRCQIPAMTLRLLDS
ncbi:hypothetical protein GGP62_003304 [Salinibacter ruber]|nr:hypothetical protein [Salinibacter ruber]